MEQPLRTLFLLDLHADAEVKFRSLVCYTIFATGFILLFVIEFLLLPLVENPLPIRALPNPLYQWIALGLIAALASFKRSRHGGEAA